MILKTKDYEIFKKYHLNREIDKRNLEVLKHSIGKSNLLSYRPIVVNTNMEVVDGQHRLEAAKQLNVEIYYQIQEKVNDDDIIYLNNQKGWDMVQYLEYWVKRKKKEYLKFQQLSIELEIPFSHLLLFTQNSGRMAFKDFKNGNFVLKNEQLIRSEVGRINKIKSYIKEKLPNQCRNFLVQKTFSKALLFFLSLDQVDSDLFFDKIQKCIGKLYTCSCSRDYVTQFTNIYNYKNQTPIAIPTTP